MKIYNPDLIPRARKMRKELTPAEMRIWMECLRLAPYKFRRQRPFGKFVVDFFCAELKLIIEVDGDSHFNDEAQAYDNERTQFLESLGLRVLRFTNDDVLYRLDSVKEKLVECFVR